LARLVRAWSAALVVVAGSGPALGQGSPGDAVVEPIDLNDPSAVGQFVTLRLDNGDVVRGTLVGVEQGRVRLEHRILGDLEVPIVRVARVERADPPAPRTAPTPPPEAPERPEGDTELLEPPPDVGRVEEGEVVVRREPDPRPAKPDVTWTQRYEVGLDGSEGNTNRLNLRTGARLERRAPGSTTRITASYLLTQADGDRTANRLTANARNDWRIRESRLSYFAQVGAEVNEFRDFDWRLTGGAGISAQLIDREKTRLDVRVGGGFSRDFGGPDERFAPELITGLEFEHRLTDRQRFELTAELFPDLDDWGEFRSVVRPAWEFKLDEATNLSLRIGLEHRYESNTTRDEPSDLDYFATLVVTF